MRCLFRYLTEQIGHMVRRIKLLRQSDDVAAFADAEVVPPVEFGVYLERGFRFLSQWRFVPKTVALLLYGQIAQTLQIVCNLDLFCFLDVHDMMFLWI